MVAEAEVVAEAEEETRKETLEAEGNPVIPTRSTSPTAVCVDQTPITLTTAPIRLS